MVNKREYLDAQARRFSGENVEARNRLKSAYRFFEKFVKSDLPLLDIGTRDGWMLDYLKRKRFTNIMGIDITEEAVRYAQSQNRNVIWGDMHNLAAFNDSEFGTILMTHSLEHCYNAKAVVSGLHRVLQLGGILYVEVPLESRAARDVAHYCNFESVHDVVKTLGTGFQLKKHKIVPIGRRLKNLLCVFERI
jgi:2-polyprenyl-3-methyl-5-hydroxy-6-metoxy-1,4-benzoquinol methylase